MNNMKRAVISDADIIIDLARVGKLNLLEKLFEHIVIPEYVYEYEITNKAEQNLETINERIKVNDGIFSVMNDGELDISQRIIKRDVFNELKVFAGKGEVECVALANALNIPLVISNNEHDFEYLEEWCILMTYYDILYFMVEIGEKSFNEAKKIYNDINSSKERPSGLSFEKRCANTQKRYNDNIICTSDDKEIPWYRFVSQHIF
jgi:predicted nucleic acid-binding protein